MSTDIVDRLRLWGGGFTGNNPDCENDCADGADEIVRLRAENARLRLTDWEREAVATAMEQIRCGSELGEPNRETAITLRLLLERTK